MRLSRLTVVLTLSTGLAAAVGARAPSPPTQAPAPAAPKVATEAPVPPEDKATRDDASSTTAQSRAFNQNSSRSNTSKRTLTQVPPPADDESDESAREDQPKRED